MFWQKAACRQPSSLRTGHSSTVTMLTRLQGEERGSWQAGDREEEEGSPSSLPPPLSLREENEPAHQAFNATEGKNACQARSPSQIRGLGRLGVRSKSGDTLSHKT